MDTGSTDEAVTSTDQQPSLQEVAELVVMVSLKLDAIWQYLHEKLEQKVWTPNG